MVKYKKDGKKKQINETKERRKKRCHNWRELKILTQEKESKRVNDERKVIKANEEGNGKKIKRVKRNGTRERKSK